MTTAGATTFQHGGSPATPFVDSVMEAKLHGPPSRADWVPRSRLLDQLNRAVGCPVVLVAAPAGYGKTTLVAQWLAGRDGRPAAWVSLDAGDNDPGRLWTHVGAALERIGCTPTIPQRDTFLPVSSGEVESAALPSMLNAVAAMPDDVFIVLDDLHLVREPACHGQLSLLIDHLPPQGHLVLLTRADPGLRLGRLRASRRLAEIRAGELGFTTDETGALVMLEGLRLAKETVAHLWKHTEGWPAGLYLATLSMRGQADPDGYVRRFSGGNRFIGAYLAEEVLSQHPPETREFLTTVSILDRFTAPLCDFVTETTSSSRLLRELERTNMFLVGLDDEGVWFRFHHLFASFARAQLELTDPDQVQALHARAAQWFREHGHIDEAVRHFLAAGDLDAAALLVQANWLKYLDAGRPATVLAWLDALGPPSVAADPAAGVTAAWMAAIVGDEKGLTRHLTALEGSYAYGPLPDGAHSVESSVAMILGVFGFGGPAEMSANARRAVELETDGRSPYYAVANMALGHSRYVAGDLEAARSRLAKSSGTEGAPAVIRVLSLSLQSLVEAELGSTQTSKEFAERAMQVVESKGLGSMPQASLAFTALGQAQAAAGGVEQAMATLEHGSALRASNPALSPWTTIHHEVVMARVLVDDGQYALARERLADARSLLGRWDDGLDAMWARVEALDEIVAHVASAGPLLEPLTDRELTVLRLLQGPLTLGEIAGELYLSSNTVKTHTRSIFRKTGAHSRAEAVLMGRRLNLI